MPQNGFNNVQVGAEAALPWGEYTPATPRPGQNIPFQQPMTASPAYQPAGRDQKPFPTMAPPPVADRAIATQPPETPMGPAAFSWSPTATPTHTPTPATTGWASATQSNWNQAAQLSAQAFARPPQQPQITSSGSKQLSQRKGYTLATLCLIIAALLLIFVHFMALGLAPSSAQAITQPKPASNNILAVPTPVATPTPISLPGQQYIDSGQTATGITSASQPTQTTSNFKVGQRVYVTFTFHTGGQSGYACVYWYQNNQQFFNYPFQALASGPSFAYATPKTTGPGYVEIYWAWSSNCLNKVMAQHVDFTVSE